MCEQPVEPVELKTKYDYNVITTIIMVKRKEHG